MKWGCPCFVLLLSRISMFVGRPELRLAEQDVKLNTVNHWLLFTWCFRWLQSIFCIKTIHRFQKCVLKREVFDIIPRPVLKSVEKSGKCAVLQHHAVTLIPMSHGMKSRTDTCWEIEQFPTRQLPRPRNHKVASWFLGPDSCLVRNYAISQWLWILIIIDMASILVLLASWSCVKGYCIKNQLHW